MTVARAIMTAATLALVASSQIAQGTERLFAAGSLREAFGALLAAYQQHSGFVLEPLYGPSGKLREQIERGDAAAVFASASIDHTSALVKAGILRESRVLARNRLCVLARRGVTVDANRLLDTLLDPGVRVGTSTPAADPSGDYTWEFFRNAEKVRPGSFALLDAKALKLTGRDVDQALREAPYARILLEDRSADVFITYCTNAAAASLRQPALTWLRIPDALNVGAVYGIGASVAATPAAAGLVPFALGEQGRAILTGFGFDEP
jgi:molybdate transport system substrate-binding protein